MPKKILVADDERHIIRLVQINLERAGYEVVTAFEGKEALEKIEAENPDLVVLDVMMPYLHGFEVLEILRKNPDTRNLPVIMMTAKAPDADVFRGWQSGVDCYVTKPFNPMELISFVRRIFASQDRSDANETETNPAASATPHDRPAQPTPTPPVSMVQPVSLWEKISRLFS